MKIAQILHENVITKELNSDPALAKKLAIMWNHDLPGRITVARLGPNPTDAQIATAWLGMVNRMISRTLANGDYLLRNSNAMKWLLKQYLAGNTGFYSGLFDNTIDDIIENLNMWCILLAKGVLKEIHRDLNKISTAIISRIVNSYDTDDIKESIELEYLMKEQSEIILIDDSEFKVSIPLKYGACRKFNLTGHPSSFCTGSSGGVGYFNRYSQRGPLIMIAHKTDISKPAGKVQISAEMNEIEMSNGTDISILRLETLYPGILKRIADAMTAKSSEITDEMQSLVTTKAYRASSTISILNKWIASLPKSKK
jgi:hypothetical protein